jgi:hypothetical protein
MEKMSVISAAPKVSTAHCVSTVPRVATAHYVSSTREKYVFDWIAVKEWPNIFFYIRPPIGSLG